MRRVERIVLVLALSWVPPAAAGADRQEVRPGIVAGPIVAAQHLGVLLGGSILVPAGPEIALRGTVDWIWTQSRDDSRDGTSPSPAYSDVHLNGFLASVIRRFDPGSARGWYVFAGVGATTVVRHRSGKDALVLEAGAGAAFGTPKTPLALELAPRFVLSDDDDMTLVPMVLRVWL